MTNVVDLSGSVTSGFEGLALGPQNLQGGVFQNTVFAITSGGQLLAIDTATGLPDTNFNGGNAITTGASSPTGLAFSPLDVNLWHTTTARSADPGHGINALFDNSRVPGSAEQDHTDPQGHNYDLDQADGGLSYYFGLEEYVDSNNQPYLNYEANRTQRGVLFNDFQRDLTSNAAIGNNYNLPGGSYGSLITNEFDLTSSTSDAANEGDRPTLYFNYFLASEDQNTNNATNSLARDTARVFISTNGGTSWETLATNNVPDGYVTTGLGPNNADTEVPDFNSHLESADNSNSKQVIQPLFDNTGTWRQARVDLSDYAGLSNVKLRFDFSTAGTIYDSANDSSAGFSLTNNNTNKLDLQTSTDVYGNLNDERRGQNNAFEGFYIDDLIIGWAERGEMITGATNDSSFFSTPDDPRPGAPDPISTGSYQLEIRRGYDFAGNPNPTFNDIEIESTFDTNERFVPGALPLATYGTFVNTFVQGDRNVEREQGHFQIEGNTIRDVANDAIHVAAAPRQNGTGFAGPGSPINFETLNNQRLAPGVAIVNNVIARFGSDGISFGGDPDNPISDPNIPAAAVPYGKIQHNTIYGGATTAGATAGVRVENNASPALLNNIIVNTGVGIDVDGSSSTTIAARNYFRGNALDTTANVTSTLSIPDNPNNVLFVDETADNFYLSGDTNPFDGVFDGALPIDRSLSRLNDRSTFVAVKSDLGIPESNVISPALDLFGQTRVDDPTQPPSGVGGEIFTDVGAIERSDFVGPFATLLSPLDNGSEDLNLLEHDATIIEPNFLTQIVVQLDDSGIGIDDSFVSRSQWELQRNGVVLTEGTDYAFSYNPISNRVTFRSFSVFPTDSLYNITVIDRSTLTGIRDIAGNPIQPNRPNDELRLDLVLDNGANDAPVNTVPTGQTTLEGTPLVFSTAGGNAISVADVDAHLGTNVVSVTIVAEHGTVIPTTVAGVSVSTGNVSVTAANKITVGTAAMMIGQQVEVGDAIFKFVDSTVVTTAGPADVSVTLGDDAATVAAALAAVLNHSTNFGAGSATAAGSMVSLSGVTASKPSDPAIVLDGATITTPDGAAAIGSRISVGGTVFTYVDAAVVASTHVGRDRGQRRRCGYRRGRRDGGGVEHQLHDHDRQHPSATWSRSLA